MGNGPLKRISFDHGNPRREHMRNKTLLAAGIALFVGAPVGAWAGICDGALSWLCPSADSSEVQTEQETRSRQVTPQRYDWTNHRVESRSLDTEANCLTRNQVRGGYPRYRVINGRHCWYASVKGEHTRKTGVDVNPYDDPIWRKTESARVEATDCEIQALKL